MIFMGMDFFDRIYAMNLDRRPDRWASFLEEADRIGIADRVERVSGLDLNEALGCTLTHVEILKKAVEARAKHTLILEDDVRFFDGFEKPLESVMGRLPEDWTIVYLGYNLDPNGNASSCPEFVSDDLLKLRSALMTSAYCVNGKFIEDFVRDVSKVREMGHPIDVVYSSLSGLYPLYGVYPMIAYQADGYSDIQKSNVHYTPRENVDHVLRSANRLPHKV